MWPFKKPPPPPPAPPVRYGTTTLQVGDECVCVDDASHAATRQKLLTRGCRYIVRSVDCEGTTPNGYGGPFVRLVGLNPTNDSKWDCRRFEKVIKNSIIERVKADAGLDVEKEREGAY